MKIIATCLVLALLAACSTPTTTSPPPSAKTDLFAVEATFTAATGLAGAYVNLPACGTAASPAICKNAGIASKVVLAVDSAKAALGTAEVLILGCPVAQYVASTATPPTATCGQPVADQTAQQQAVTAVQTAITALQAAIPILQSSGEN